MPLPPSIVLTFDDGPHPETTPLILAILKELNVPATFFVCGANAERYPHLVKAIHAAGHAIGNHTYNHRLFTSLLGLTYQEIRKTETIIEALVGPQPKLYRPPWGKTPFWLTERLIKEGYTIVPYTVHGWDWSRFATAESITNRITRNTRDGSILLLHDGREAKKTVKRASTVAAIPTIVANLRRRNFTFVSNPNESSVYSPLKKAAVGSDRKNMKNNFSKPVK